MSFSGCVRTRFTNLIPQGRLNFKLVQTALRPSTATAKHGLLGW